MVTAFGPGLVAPGGGGGVGHAESMHVLELPGSLMAGLIRQAWISYR
jgi:hypothetical protein